MKGPMVDTVQSVQARIEENIRTYQEKTGSLPSVYIGAPDGAEWSVTADNAQRIDVAELVSRAREQVARCWDLNGTQPSIAARWPDGTIWDVTSYVSDMEHAS